ncbi:recombinase family protein [Streptomyces asiaticus]
MTPTPQLRALAVIRLSVLTDETTSPARQRAAIDAAAASLGAVVGDRVAEDLDVSASKTAPADRPELGPWLARPDEFDVLAAWRFDRVIRSMNDMYWLAQWATEHRKLIVFAEGIGGGGQMSFDFRNPMDPLAKFLLAVFAFAAEVEATNIRDRVIGAQAAMRQMPLRFRGGHVPYGYRVVDLDGGGKTLAPDDHCVGVLETIIKRLREKKTRSGIARLLEEAEELTPRDYKADQRGKSRGGKTGTAKGRKSKVHEKFKWTGTTVERLLRSEHLMGWKMYKGRPVRDADGNPVMATDRPILTRAEFDAVQALLDNTSMPFVERSDNNALLFHVMYCAGCDTHMYLDQGKYVCRADLRGIDCPAPTTVKAEWLDEWATKEFLDRVGPLRVVTVIEVAGYDPGPELEDVRAEYREHLDQRGKQRSKTAQEEWQRHADKLDARMAELESREAIPAHRKTSTSDRTYADDWNAKDVSGKRAMMLDAGARVVLRKGTKGGWRSLDTSRVSMTIDGPLNEAIEELAALRSSLADE